MSKLDMESRPLERSLDSRPISVYIAPYEDRGDEVTLIDLWKVIARRKGIILLSFLASMMLAAVYIFFAEPVYKANAYLLPPQQQKIQGLLIDYQEKGIDVDPYTPESVYRAFLDNLNSKGVRRAFFENHELTKHYVAGESKKNINADRIFEKLFNDRLKVQVDKQRTLFVTVSFSDSDPTLAAQWLNQIIDYVNKHTVHQLFSDVNSAIQSEIGKTRFQLDSKLKLAERRRLDEIIVLKEALQIANALGIQDSSTFAKMAEKTQSGLVVNTAAAPLYTQGKKALEAQISAREARKSNEAFISGFRDLQERRAFLEGISIDPDTLSAVTKHEAARIPYQREKPRKRLILLVAALLGVLGGVFAAFFTDLGFRTNPPRSS